MKDYLGWLLLVKWAGRLQRAPYAVLSCVSFMAGTAHYLLNHRARRAIRRGFQTDFGVRPPEAWVWESICRHQQNDLELVIYPIINTKFVEQKLEFIGDGWTFLRENPDLPAVLLTVHFGPNQIMIPAFPAMGIPFLQIAVPPTYWNQLLQVSKRTAEINVARTRYLEATGTDFLYVSEGMSVMRQAYRALRQGRKVCLAGDGRAGTTITAPFMKGHIDIAPGGMDLAERCHCPLLPVFCIRTSRGIRIWMPDVMEITTANRNQRLRDWVQRLEEVVKQYPGQYGWIYHAKSIGG